MSSLNRKPLCLQRDCFCFVFWFYVSLVFFLCVSFLSSSQTTSFLSFISLFPFHFDFPSFLYLDIFLSTFAIPFFFSLSFFQSLFLFFLYFFHQFFMFLPLVSLRTHTHTHTHTHSCMQLCCVRGRRLQADVITQRKQVVD